MFFLPHPIFAQGSSFVSIVNPVRGSDFWDLKNQDPQTAVFGQVDILNRFNLPATWLYRFDALNDQKIVEALKIRSIDEKGLFLEVTPALTNAAGVSYRKSQNWHNAGSAFLTGYEPGERIKLIDTAFEKFKQTFGDYPKSVGAWWIDSYSLEYMQKKYGISASLIVSDQYSTDNYQIWGQYFSTPYYPSKKNALHPAQTIENKLSVVMMQWAPRDPVNSYGNGVMESTFSVQANDYLDYHNLDTKYFLSLIDIYTKQTFNQFSHLVVGLENSYSWEKYKAEYKNQIEVLSKKKNTGEISIVTMKDFASWYKNRFPGLSPPQIIVADDPLGSFKKVIWFMNPYFRAGWFFNKDGSLFRDIRQYIDGEQELCFQSRCDSVNFATSATRVLDEVSFGQKWVIDEGKISDFKVIKQGDNFVINYKNEAGNARKIEFLPRDISVDGKISSIDGAILEATKSQLDQQKNSINLTKGWFNWSAKSVTSKILKFLIFIIIGCLVPGLLMIKKVFSEETPFWKKISLSLPLGFVLITLLFYLLSLVDFRQGIFIYLIFNLLLLIKTRKQIFSNFSLKFKDRFSFILIGLIGTGTIFQQLPVFKSGLHFPYGLGFWGPNTHDGIWHISLINQLVKSATPPENPILARESLINYHFFYDLFVALTNYVSAIPISDLLFRFYPIIFSLLLGILTYFLINLLVTEKNLWKKRLAYFFGIYLVYFSGSFGWIVEYIKVKHLGGESAFWANQSISFNLNPPFAISLLIVITILQLLPNLKNKSSILIITILAGSLIAFKAYPAILILLSLAIVGILKRNIQYIYVFLFGLFLSTILFLFTFSVDKQLIIFSPFWFIHSMIDSPDRVGWVRLSLARVAGWESGNWFKFLTAELISLVIFILGNLGTRVFALLYLRKMKHIVRHTNYLFIFVFSFLSLIIPVFFIQSGNPWNTIQFIYYGLYISAVVGGIIFAQVISRINKILALIFAVLFLLITPINSWATANGYLSYQPHALVTNEELEALNFLKTKEEGVVLTYPYDQKLKTKMAEPWPILMYDSTSYVSALSGKVIFVEDEPQNQILLTEYKKRIVAAKDFFAGSFDFNFLLNNNIKYIYLPKIYGVRFEESSKVVKNIFENEEVVIYEANF